MRGNPIAKAGSERLETCQVLLKGGKVFEGDCSSDVLGIKSSLQSSLVLSELTEQLPPLFL